MFNAQPLRTNLPTASPARSARARLLNDPALRRNLPAPASAHGSAPPASITFTPRSAELIRPFSAENALSRAEQERRARQVAQSFRGHYLAELTYHPEQQIALATIRPREAAQQPDTAHQICVEANGTVSVLHHAGPLLVESHLVLRRLLVLVGGLTAVLGTLFSLVLF